MTEKTFFNDAIKGAMNGQIARRQDFERMTDIERVLLGTIHEIEQLGADPRLTEASALLDRVRDLVADVEDGVEPPKDPDMQRGGLTIRDFQRLNQERNIAWHAGGDPWCLADWGNELAGETGEACNIVKKIRRIETDTLGNKDGEGLESLKASLARELGDVVTCAALLANASGIDLELATASKFNAVSRRNNLPFIIPVTD